jgi:hypothetical protein
MVGTLVEFDQDRAIGIALDPSDAWIFGLQADQFVLLPL